MSRAQLVYNILLLCLGRHPLQNPGVIKPDIDKLPKSVVDQIPLVLYIPPPPGEPADGVAAPPAAHQYPPKSPASPAAAPKRRFVFFRRKKGGKGGASGSGAGGSGDGKGGPGQKCGRADAGGAEGEGGDADADVPWDEMWEKGEHPFVRLEGNRAVCAICLVDFEEPRRVHSARPAPPVLASPAEGVEDALAGDGEAAVPGTPGPSSPSSSAPQAPTQGKTEEIQVETVSRREEEDALQLNDAGEGAQPLRLLSCGHVFHVRSPIFLRAALVLECESVLRSRFSAENVLGSVAHERVGAVPDLPARGGDIRPVEEGQAAPPADSVMVYVSLWAWLFLVTRHPLLLPTAVVPPDSSNSLVYL